MDTSMTRMIFVFNTLSSVSRLVFLLTIFCLPVVCFATPLRTPEIQVIDIDTHTVQMSIPVEGGAVNTGIKPLVADIDGDGSVEMIVFESTGTQVKPLVRIYDRHGVQKKIYPLFVPENAGTEISAAVGNIDTDSELEIVVSYPRSSNTAVYVYDAEFKYNNPKKSFFVAFPEVSAGARVTLANVAGGGQQEIIAGTTAGVKAQVGMFFADGKQYGRTIFPFAESDMQGVTLAAVHSSGELYEHLVIGLSAGAQTWYKVYTIDSAFAYPVVAEKRVWSREWESGVQLGSADITHDGTDELLVAPLQGKQAEIVFFSNRGEATTIPSLYAFEEQFRGGAEFAVAQMDSDLSLELIIAPRVQDQLGDLSKGEKYIEVDLSEQTTTLWENGYVVQQFLISSGLAPRFTPTGETKINYKKPLINYDGRIFGESYFFGNTPWNLQFRSGGYFFHTAYWHNDFGRPKSHGCINMKEPDAHFLYDWALIGTTVIVHG